MAARLGQVLYWAFFGLAVIVIAFAIACGIFNIDGMQWWPALWLTPIAAIIWLIGRACKYVLAGE